MAALQRASLKSILRHAVATVKAESDVSSLLSATPVSLLFDALRSRASGAQSPSSLSSPTSSQPAEGAEHALLTACAHTLSSEHAFKQEVSLHPLQGGNSNAIFLVHYRDAPTLLYRRYGTSMERVLDRDDDVRGCAAAARAKIGPQLIHVFDGGRLEEFFHNAEEATTAKWLDPANPHYLTALAASMVALHQVHPNGHVPTSSGENALDKILQRLYQALSSAADASQPSQLYEAFLADMRDDIAWLLGLLRDAPVVFCHNDINPGNVLYRHNPCKSETGSTNAIEAKLIDFEYSGVNYRCFDVGNTVCEMNYDYCALETYEKRLDGKPIVVHSTGEPKQQAPTTSVNECQAGFRKPFSPHLLASAGEAESGYFYPHLAARLWKMFRESLAGGRGDANDEDATDATARHILQRFLRPYFCPGERGELTAEHMTEVFVGMLASHLQWGMWGSVLAVYDATEADETTVYYPRGGGGLDYAAYGECRLLEFYALRRWLLGEKVLPSTKISPPSSN